MSRQPEGRLQLLIRKALELEFPGSWWIKVHGGPYQSAGIPDLIGCVRGTMFGLEVKLPGERATLIQLATLDKMKLAGACTGIVTGIEEALEFVHAELFKWGG